MKAHCNGFTQAMTIPATFLVQLLFLITGTFHTSFLEALGPQKLSSTATDFPEGILGNKIYCGGSKMNLVCWTNYIEDYR